MPMRYMNGVGHSGTGRRTQSSQTNSRLQVPFTGHGGRSHGIMGLKSRLGKYNGPVTCILCLRSHFKIAFKEPERRGLSAGSTADDEQKAAAAAAGGRPLRGRRRGSLNHGPPNRGPSGLRQHWAEALSKDEPRWPPASLVFLMVLTTLTIKFAQACKNVAEAKSIEPRARSLASIPSLPSTAQGISSCLASVSSSLKAKIRNSDFLPPRVGLLWGFSWQKICLPNAGDPRDSGSIPGSGRSPEEGNGNPV